MKASLHTLLVSFPMALMALGAAGPASARHDRDVQVYVAQPMPAPVRRPVYLVDYDDYAPRGDWHRGSCGAPRWEPSVRYAPGDAVWRHGALYVATRVSAHAWNVNSPPEWTPNYWVTARC